MIQLVWTPGASKYFNRPSAEQALFAKNVVANNLSNPAHEIRNLGNYGKVETTVSSPVLKNSTLNSSTPFAPSCTADDTANTISCGSVDPATLEVSTNGGTSYSAFNAATTYAGAQTVLVRVKAQGTNPASPATTLNFTENYVVPMLPASLSDIGPVGDNG